MSSKSKIPGKHNDWHFVTEVNREEFLGMSGNLLANIGNIDKTPNIDMLGYVFDFWNHTFDQKAQELFRVLAKKMGKETLGKTYASLTKSLSRCETAEKMDLFDKFYKQTLE